MKRSSALLPVLCLGLTAVRLPAQIADLILVEKLTQYTQTSASAPNLSGSMPYRFDVSISSLNDDHLGGITAPTVTLAVGSNAPSIITTGHNGGTLVFNEDEWRYGSDGYGWNVGSVGNLNALFASGPTSVSVQGHTYSLDLDGSANNQAFFPPAVPTLTFTGGLWSGGKYVINPSQSLTITTSNWTGFTTAGIGGFMNINLDGVGTEVVFSRIAPEGMDSLINESVTSATFTVPAGTLTAGQDYEGFATFARFVSQDTSQAGIFATAWWGNETSFTISAIPEPSTYAALAGLGALGLVFWRRCKQADQARLV